MKYETLANAMELLALKKRSVLRMNCEGFTSQWLRDTFSLPESKSKFLLDVRIPAFFGIPIYVVEHMARGFVEVEYDDNTRTIINLKPKEKPMQKFYGTKLIAAKPMTRGEYNKYRGWEMPSNEDAAETGYLVEYLDGGKGNDERHTGYITWTPTGPFENAYQPTDALSFGHAIMAMKSGMKVARAGWNGKGMFIYRVPAASYPAQTDVAKKQWGADGKVPYRAYYAMKTVDGDVAVWTCSQTDMDADDWQIVD